MIYKILNWLMPTQCVGCDHNSEYICKNCRKNLISHQETCNICHKYSEDFVVCRGCRSEVYYEGIVILREFSNLVKKIIYKLKFWHRYDTVSFLAEKLRLILQTNQHIYESDNIDNIYISYVPSHRRRKYRIKGYNQSELLAIQLSKISGLKFVDISKKVKYTVSQVKLNRNQRLVNLIDSYRLVDNLTLNGSEKIIIVDDITTTGSTINHLAKTIKYIYPNIHIWGLVIARSNK